MRDGVCVCVSAVQLYIAEAYVADRETLIEVLGQLASESVRVQWQHIVDLYSGV